jgi:L-aspartate oxidase
MERFDVIVAGAGVAGLCTALAAAPKRVLLVCRGRPGSDGSSAWAQGGIAAAVGHGDDPAQHAEDTIRAGAGYNNRDAVELLTRAAPHTISWLQAQGLAFDRSGDELALGREGGHLRDRILHAGGDATGTQLMRALGGAVKEATHVSVLPETELSGLLLAGDTVAGGSLRDIDGRLQDVEAGAVVMATGGIGALYRYTTNPTCADGSGLAIALAAGAEPADLEFVQFHPTALAPASNTAGHRLPLVTEALRGAGAVLVTGEGRRLMAGHHPMLDLAPRDVVARKVWAAQAAGERVLLDARALGPSFARRFPTVHASCTALGLDPARTPIPIVPAQHFHMGGIRIDPLGRSSIAGLFAVGEVACSGVHGANRLASNSLLEGAVFGRRLGEHLARSAGVGRAGFDRRAETSSGADPGQLDELRALLWRHLGLLRDAAGLQQAIASIHSSPLQYSWQGQLAAQLCQAALLRRDSLGSHHRLDAPARARA